MPAILTGVNCTMDCRERNDEGRILDETGMEGFIRQEKK